MNLSRQAFVDHHSIFTASMWLRSWQRSHPALAEMFPGMACYVAGDMGRRNRNTVPSCIHSDTIKSSINRNVLDSMFALHLFIMSGYGEHVMASVWSWFSPSSIRLPGIKLGPSDLAPSAFTH